MREWTIKNERKEKKKRNRPADLSGGDGEDGAALGVDAVDVAAPEEQQLDDVGVAHGGGGQQRRPPAHVGSVHVGLGLQQQLARRPEREIQRSKKTIIINYQQSLNK